MSVIMHYLAHPCKFEQWQRWPRNSPSGLRHYKTDDSLEVTLTTRWRTSAMLSLCRISSHIHRWIWASFRFTQLLQTGLLEIGRMIAQLHPIAV